MHIIRARIQVCHWMRLYRLRIMVPVIPMIGIRVRNKVLTQLIFFCIVRLGGVMWVSPNETLRLD